MKLLVNCLIAIALCAMPAFAAEIPINGHGSDQGISATGGSWSGQADVRVGAGSTSPSGMALIFELPVLEVGETVSSADLAFTILSGNNYNALYNHGIHLYGVRLTDTASAGSADFYNGAFADVTNGVGIEEFIVFESEQLNQGAPGVTGLVNSSEDAALGSWIQSMYDSASYDASGSNYVVLTLMPDENFTSSYRYWTVASANNSNTDARPLLTLTTVPEPATIGLLAIGAVSLIRRKK